METLITVDRLKKYYEHDGITVKAVDDVSFEIKKGEMVAIVGPSGSGKTTLLNLLGTLDKPSSGKVLFGKQNIYDLENKELAQFRNQKIGFVFQFFNLIPEFTARENILFPLWLKKDRKTDYMNELCNILKIEDRLEHYPNELSGGQQQRVAFARALINKPDIILCDEPTGNLDEKSTMEMLDFMKELNRKTNQTFLIVTHDDRVSKICDRVFNYVDGKIVE